MKLFIIFTFILILHLLVLVLGTINQDRNQVKKVSIILKRKSEKEKDKKTQTKFKSFNKALFLNLKDILVKNIKLDKEGTRKNELYEFIDEGLTFPADFQQFSIQGAVRAKLYFDSRGKFIIKRSLFHAKSGFLRFHVMNYLEGKLKTYKLATKEKNGFVPMSFVFNYTTSGLVQPKLLMIDEFVFNRSGFQAETIGAKVLLEVGQTLLSLLNLLKFRPDFLRSNEELQSQQRTLHKLQRIRSHPYYR